MLKLYLPIPTQALRSNGSFGKAWSYRDAFRKAKAAAVMECERVLKDAKMPPPKWRRAGYVLTCCHATPQRMDPDNLIAACKAYIDGIAAAGVIVNDRDLYPDRPAFRRVDRMPRVEIEIYEIEDQK